MRGLWLLVPVGTLVAVALLAREPLRAQDAPSPTAPLHFGAGSCAAQACHGGADPARTEYKVWSGAKDKHSRAWDLLGGDLGRRMGERLGIDPSKAPECLNCHGTVGVRKAVTFDEADGVSCELCHGGAEKWLARHALPEWQQLQESAKEKLGLRDLTTPHKRVQTCVQCHVAGEGRDISHEIMAAGHPPLVFDAATFMREMPPHWKVDDETDWTAATWVQGHVAGAVAIFERIARETKGERAPDFTVFDCYSCHHAIYAGSVYEKTKPPARPGDLPYELAALKVLVIATGRAEFLDRLEDSLRTWTPHSNRNRGLPDRARAAAADLKKLFPPDEQYDGKTLRQNLDRYLAQVAQGDVRVPRAEMQQLALAVDALGGGANEAFGALDQALAANMPYDAVRCAEMARKALAAASD